MNAAGHRQRKLIFPTPPGRERDCKKSYIFKLFFDCFQKFENSDAFFCTPQAFWASHFLKLQNRRSPDVTLIVVSRKATLAAREVLKKLELAPPRITRVIIFCDRRRAWGCEFWHPTTPPRREPRFWQCENLKIEKKMMLKPLVWRASISKITRTKKLLKFYRASHSKLKT